MACEIKRFGDLSARNIIGVDLFAPPARARNFKSCRGVHSYLLTSRTYDITQAKDGSFKINGGIVSANEN